MAQSESNRDDVLSEYEAKHLPFNEKAVLKYQRKGFYFPMFELFVAPFWLVGTAYWARHYYLKGFTRRIPINDELLAKSFVSFLLSAPGTIMWAEKYT
jgi:hypothetical protein